MATLFSARTDVGRVREQNEDNFLVDRKLQLYIVCDGMGGHSCGEVASATAVNVVRESLIQHRELLEAYERGVGAVEADDIRALLTQAIQHASNRIYERGMMNPEQRGMGTTLSLLLFLGGEAFIGHVGDSRIYRRRGGAVRLLTEDHSLMNAMKQSGAGEEEMAMATRLSNAVTRAVGVQESVEVDTDVVEVEPGDLFLLCSDGLCGYFEEDEEDILRLLEAPDLQRAADEMIRYANEQGGKDNITAVLVEATGETTTRPTEPDADLDEALRASYLARGLDEAARATLLDQVDLRIHEAGEVVADEGAEGDDILLVASGRLEATTPEGARRVLRRGDVLGDVTALAGAAHPVAVRVSDEGPARVLALTRDAMGALAEDHPSLLTRLALNLSRGMGRRLLLAAEALGDPIWAYGAVGEGDEDARPRTRGRKATTTVDLDPDEIMEADPEERAAPAAEVPPPVPPHQTSTSSDAEDDDRAEPGFDVEHGDTLPGVPLDEALAGELSGPSGGDVERPDPGTDPGSRAS